MNISTRVTSDEFSSAMEGNFYNGDNNSHDPIATSVFVLFDWETPSCRNNILYCVFKACFKGAYTTRDNS